MLKCAALKVSEWPIFLMPFAFGGAEITFKKRNRKLTRITHLGCLIRQHFNILIVLLRRHRREEFDCPLFSDQSSHCPRLGSVTSGGSWRGGDKRVGSGGERRVGRSGGRRARKRSAR
jgi:hypothetical protein